LQGLRGGDMNGKHCKKVKSSSFQRSPTHEVILESLITINPLQYFFLRQRLHDGLLRRPTLE
ncbi:MAG: hypothetical protein JXR53_09765, partial [Bacteroidales bacterium]|nr:hypothetical protein [Bacteroidales bacterium]